ncbi:hypothetical protein FL966_05885 [Caproiciproducens galactitolivorans]|uniref:Uncharacterized protein n=1 Tax=Caproiciproducens galactitolivorans TaxID=642589 RepID=A0A4Z0YC48_9FIRM|nr:hypothetical protein [Caproiciproducens galactitolivorans]QEY34619.1 hypothetical protein FL966_05885 [Caproiciproducens galactitolivorans]TGJ75416.1 hypothetical protein CAGA_24400 [Caproiciproducens galactitolivorans]
MNAGELNEQISVLELQQIGIVCGWNVKRVMFGKVEKLNKTNLFSQVGIGVKSVKFTVRKQDLSLFNAFRWKGDFYFLTDIVEIKRMYYEVTAARIEPKICTVTRITVTKNERKNPVKRKEILLTFPGCLVEKYMGYAQQKPQAVSEIQYVLVTPKAVALKLADLVEIEGVTYNVQIAHTLDQYKNEYEILVQKDV